MKHKIRNFLGASSFFLLLQGCATPTTDIRIAKPTNIAPVTPTGVAMAGAATVDITPPPGLSMGGYSLMANSGKGFRTRLKARAIYLQSADGKSFAWLQTDSGTGSLLMHHLVASQVADLGLAPGNITVTATHSHSTPVNFFENDFYNKHFSAKQGLEPDYVKLTASRLVEALRTAYENRREAKFATGKLSVYGINRNRSLAAYARNENVGKIDLKDPKAVFKHVNPDLMMLRIDAKDDSGAFVPLAALGSFAVHATTLSAPVEVYNADLFAYAQKDLQWTIGKEYALPWSLVAALSTSTQGDMAPAVPDTGNNYFTHKPVDWKHSREVGSKLGKAAIELFHDLGDKLTTDLELASAAIEVDLRTDNQIDDEIICPKPLVGGAVAGGAYERRTPYLSVLPVLKGGTTSRRWWFFKDGCQGDKRILGFKSLQPLFEPTDSFPRYALFQAHKINDMLILPVPFEMTTEAARRVVKNASQQFKNSTLPIAYGWMASVSNGYFGYSTTKEEYSYQNYEGAHTLYGQHSTAYISAQLAKLAASIAADKPIQQMLPKWEYHLKTGHYMPDNHEYLGERRELSRKFVKGKHPERDEDYIAFEWQDIGKDQIDYHLPLAKVEVKTDTGWQLLYHGLQAIDDDGYDLEVRYLGMMPKKVAKMAHYQLRWYNPVKGGTYRFVIAPRANQPVLYSQEFSF